MRKGFTLIEMLVVIGIIMVLIGASIGSYSAVTRSAEKAKCRELVAQVATALTTLYQREGGWPKALAMQGKTDGKLDEKACMAFRTADSDGKYTSKYYSLNFDDNGNPAGYDRFGIVTPWAFDVIKRGGKGVSLTTQVSTSKHGPQTVDDHILHYALDLDGDGIIEGASVGGESVDVRATAIVWCAGKDGYIERYSKGQKGDDVYSWTPGQTKKVK